jgi:hypothetical protein
VEIETKAYEDGDMYDAFFVVLRRREDQTMWRIAFSKYKLRVRIP